MATIKYRILDQNGDYQFGHGLQDITYGSYAVAQAIKTRLSLLKGEWWENIEKGFPLFQNIIAQRGSQKNIELADLIIKDMIISTPNVISLSDFTSMFDKLTRTYSFKCNVKTPFGDVVVAKTF